MSTAAPPGNSRSARQVPCPTCSRPALFAPENAWRPFCSERCRSVDLGAWASERYRVEAKPDPSDDDTDTPAH
ncbi:DNA gyrase inhibitor YacG [Aquabacterium sp.]|uniref:DNA gyrase inhibitor YacG n=1 Tax=Aquabacterium sp. TaxID=1872578 RepID=UPI002C649EEE|nr:DNA gyrase inhibitor YacG [Aquabacterium sp.]HSW07046.1 DNA gyrase inhibitor YacG [Aquabacterium sp.]